MMKRYVLMVILMAVGMVGQVDAQELVVKEMQALPMDLSASQYERNDLNGKSCALVKVQLATTGAQFEGNVVGNTDYKTNEYWVYMTEGSYMLSIKHPSFVTLSVNFRDYGINGVQGKSTYQLTLLMPQGGPVNVDDGLRYLVMTVEPANASVYIDNQPQMVWNGTLSMLLPMGEHSYRVESPPAYETKSGTFTIGNEKLSLPVKLESNMAQLTISSSTQGTLIFVNDQLRGTSSWSGTLPAGTYRIEGRLQGYRNHRQNITLVQRDRQQISIPALLAITGNLNVNYQPANAEVWIDDKKVGTSPDVFRNLLVGQHQVEIRKEGFTSKKESVTIEEGQTALLSGSLERLQSAQTESPVPSAVSPFSGGQVETITVKGVSFNMVRVDGGTFQMGSTTGDDDEKPVHSVTLSSFSIGQTEVTQALWKAVMGKNPSERKGDNLPVESVSWDDCQDFVRKLSQLTGKNFRLPTEAEWEYAARGGNKSRGYQYSGSNNLGDVAWYWDNSSRTTHPVRTKQANELGLYDMSGNVWEWCQDRKGDYSNGAQTNPTGPSTGSDRVYRGGSWFNFAGSCRVAIRDDFTPGSRYYALGLRLAL